MLYVFKMTDVIARRVSLQNCCSTNNNNNNAANAAFNITRTNHSEALLQGLNALRCAEKLFDVTLLVEGRVFKAHRVVLAACSDYFCAMFNDCGFSESRKSEIQLNGINAHGIELLLEYAYTAKLELDVNNVQDVLAASSHVQMQSVIEACANFLETQIDLDSFVAIASLADLYALETLKKKVYRYICSQLAEFAQTPDFINLSWEQWEQILACNYPVNCTEYDLLCRTLHFCREKSLSYYSVARLLHQIRFNQVDINELNMLLRNLSGSNVMFIKMLCTEVNKEHEKQISRKSKKKLNAAQRNNETTHTVDDDDEHVNCSDAEDIVATDMLVNMRGMELALVKIGGFETNGLTNQISCFVPSKGKWENLTVIPHIEQCNYGAAVLGNDLFIVGGSYDVCLKEFIHPFGFRYCAAKNTWSTMAPMRFDRCRFSLNAMGNNYLYAVGGAFEPNEHGDLLYVCSELSLYNCERYNAIVDRWERVPALPENRSQHAGVVLDEKLYISGGFERHVVLSSLWCLDTKTNEWSKLSPMPTPRADHSLIVLGNYIYACGGWFEDPETETRVLADAIDVYNVETDEWVTETRNPMPKFYTGVAALKRRIYFIGGLLSQPAFNRTSATVQCYDVDKQQWSCKSEWEYPQEVWECTCAAIYIPRERDTTCPKV